MSKIFYSEDQPLLLTIKIKHHIRTSYENSVYSKSDTEANQQNVRV